MLDCFLVGNMLWMFGVVAKKMLHEGLHYFINEISALIAHQYNCTPIVGPTGSTMVFSFLFFSFAHPYPVRILLCKTRNVIAALFVPVTREIFGHDWLRS
jgi:hypothetical protein